MVALTELAFDAF